MLPPAHTHGHYTDAVGLIKVASALCRTADVQ